MAGYNTFLKLKRLEEEANKLGFRFGNSKYGMRATDGIAICPKDDALPLYARDAEIMYGTDDEIEKFFRGIAFAKQYYTALRLIDDKKVARKEQDVRNRNLVKTLKGEVIDQSKIGKA